MINPCFADSWSVSYFQILSTKLDEYKHLYLIKNKKIEDIKSAWHDTAWVTCH